MIKSIQRTVWVFDLEWVPDPDVGRIVYHMPPGATDAEVYAEMWRHAGATTENPRPYLKTPLCQIVSASVLVRKVQHDGRVSLRLRSYPPVDADTLSEAQIIQEFLNDLGADRPQLVGFNSHNADIPILIQRGVACGIVAREFCERPAKPWEGIDYFVRYGEHHVDLRDIMAGSGAASASLLDLTSAAGIPCKLGASGSSVIDLWVAGNRRRIVEYNEQDTIATYLLWARLAHFSGLLSSSQYDLEMRMLEEGLVARNQRHLTEYLDSWRHIRKFRR